MLKTALFDCSVYMSLLYDKKQTYAPKAAFRKCLDSKLITDEMAKVKLNLIRLVECNKIKKSYVVVKCHHFMSYVENVSFF